MNQISCVKMYTLKKIILLFILFLFFNNLKAQEELTKTNQLELWVDSVFSSLTLEERIAQSIMTAAYSNKDDNHISEIASQIRDYKIGGLIFMQGGPMRQVRQTNYYQSLAKVPLFISMDAEWGLSMRLDSTLRFPRQMTMGGIKDNKLVYEMATQIALELKRMGVHINFAPVADVNNNSLNPVINTRSFGEDIYNVTEKSFEYIRGLQDNGIIATAKHFPGHGDTYTDSHFGLPQISHSRKRLDSIELFPFKQLINRGVEGVMVGHLNIPSLDTTKNLASTLSPEIITNLLKKELNFNGLIFTDALNMKGVSESYKPGELEVKAYLAGNDILLFPPDIPKTIQQLRDSALKNKMYEDLINVKCKKILAFKYIAGLAQYKPISEVNLYADITNSKSKYLIRKLTESSLTVLKNSENRIPLKRLDTLSIASIAIGVDTISNTFQNTLSLYSSIDKYLVNKNASKSVFDSLLKKVINYNLVIVSLHLGFQQASQKYGITANSVQFIQQLSNSKKVILDVFSSPYSIKQLEKLDSISSLIVSFENSDVSQELSAQLIFGGIGAKGNIPVTINNNFPLLAGLKTYSTRLKYTMPEELNYASSDFNKIDSIVGIAIDNKATPGCQILIAKDEKIIYNKSFGFQTYSKTTAVKNTDLYDIASITKIAATVPSVMKLYEENKLDIYDKLGDYLCDLNKSNKEKIKIIDVLTHQAKLQPWIGFYLKTLQCLYPEEELISTIQSEKYPFKLDNHKFLNRDYCFKENIFSTSYSDSFTVIVANGLYMNKKYIDTIYNFITQSELREKKEYKYSDLGYYYLYKIITQLSNQPFNDYLKEQFYNKLGASTLGFLPLKNYKIYTIVPTENDQIFRKQIIRGYVHDPGAAMMGGVCGHAGLFSNANDLAKVMQLFLNKGEYAGECYLKPETINLFTSCPNCKNKNRRGIGFDKPEPNNTLEGPTAKNVPLSSFGHTGFSGTFAWADPENNLVYIFLSNRIYPDQDNTKLSDLNIRTQIQEIIYNIIKK